MNTYDDGSGNDQAVTSAHALDALREEFPRFRVWREDTGGRVRYVSRSRCAGLNPHTAVTGDLGELRSVLAGDLDQPPAAAGRAFDAGTPSVARVYDRWLGGKDNFAADRAAADALTAEFPEIAELARANRQFVTRAVRHVAARGITQYIDVGAGLPASPAVHEAARKAQPGARVAYVDNDPVVLSHARAFLAAGPGVVVVPGDMREPEAILVGPDLRALIDLRQPVCVVLAAVLHFVAPGEADAIAAAFTAAMAPGSYLILSAGTSTGTSPALISRLTAAYRGTTVVTGRADGEIAGYFSGLQLEPPGLVDVWAWRPECEWFWPRPAQRPGTRRGCPQASRQPRAARGGPGRRPPRAVSGRAGRASVSQVPPPGAVDARAPEDDAACWRHAERLRREHPPWVVIWIAQTRQYRGYRRSVTLTAETPEDLAAQITQAGQARS